MMRKIRIAAWALVAILAAVIAYVLVSGKAGREMLDLAGAKIGGPFTLERTDGATVTDKDILGKPHALFFGFTHCPEVCPTTLWEASGWLQQLGDDADRFAFYFITVDPERDTRELLADYISAFDPRITGLTGTPEQVNEVKAAYRVFSRKVPLGDGDYTMDHTATVFLMHADGSFAGTIAWQENPETAIAKIRRLIEND